MRNLMLLPLLVVVSSLSSGCVWYTYRDVEVIVTDGETGEPVSEVVVAARPFMYMAFNHPKPMRVTTNSEGRGWGKLTNKTPSAIHIQAEGYIDRLGIVSVPQSFIDLPDTDEYHIACVAKDRSLGRPTDQIILQLFRKPAPSLRIVVPDGYRGLIKIHIPSYPGPSPHQPPDREFEITTNDHGDAGVIESHLMWRGFDRLSHVIVFDGQAEYTLSDQNAKGVAARHINLYQVRGLLIHLGDEDSFRDTAGALPGWALRDGRPVLVDVPGYDEERALMRAARQVTPQ